MPSGNHQKPNTSYHTDPTMPSCVWISAHHRTEPTVHIISAFRSSVRRIITWFCCLKCDYWAFARWTFYIRQYDGRPFEFCGWNVHRLFHCSVKRIYNFFFFFILGVRFVFFLWLTLDVCQMYACFIRTQGSFYVHDFRLCAVLKILCDWKSSIFSFLSFWAWTRTLFVVRLSHV